MHYWHPMHLSRVRDVHSEIFQEGLWASPDVQLEGGTDLLGPAGVLLCLRLFPAFMSPQEQRFDGLFGLAGGQSVICPT